MRSTMSSPWYIPGNHRSRKQDRICSRSSEGSPSWNVRHTWSCRKNKMISKWKSSNSIQLHECTRLWKYTWPIINFLWYISDTYKSRGIGRCTAIGGSVYLYCLLRFVTVFYKSLTESSSGPVQSRSNTFITYYSLYVINRPRVYSLEICALPGFYVE